MWNEAGEYDGKLIFWILAALAFGVRLISYLEG